MSRAFVAIALTSRAAIAHVTAALVLMCVPFLAAVSVQLRAHAVNGMMALWNEGEELNNEKGMSH
jgi:hypothetical protein